MNRFAVRAPLSCIPVTHDQSPETPLLPQNTRAKIKAVADIVPVYPVIAGHHSPRLALCDSDPESTEIYLPQSPLGNICGHAHAVVLLIVAAEMLDRNANTAAALHAAGDSCCHLAGNDRIFRVILKVSAAQGIPVNIQSRRQPDGNADLQHFFAHRSADFL